MIYIRIIFLVLFFVSYIYAQDIEYLFKKYVQLSQPYKKTLKETLGHYIVYTREDIEKMGAYRLVDLLKSVPFGSILPNLFGFATYNFGGIYDYVPFYTKLYINDHEVSSLYFGSPFVVWEDIPLDNIDHVEVYFFTGATAIGNEPTAMIIKLYTKDPTLENIPLYARLGTSSRGGYDTSFLFMNHTGNLSYLVMFNQKFNDKKDLYLGGRHVKRDSLNRYIYAQVKYKDTSVEFGEGHINRYPFLGFALDGTPDSGKVFISERYIHLTQKFLDDKSLKLNISLDNNYRNFYISNQNLIYIPAFWDNTDLLNNPVYYDEKINFFKYNFYLSKIFKTKHHNLLVGSNVKYYDYRIRWRNYITASGSSMHRKYITPFTKEKVFSYFVEDIVKLNKKNVAIVSVRYDDYRRNGGFKDYKEYVARVGYVYAPSKKFTCKVFFQRYYIAPFFYHIDFAQRDLDTQKVPYYVSTEFLFKKENENLSIIIGTAKLKDTLTMKEPLIFSNDKKNYYPSILSITYDKKIDNFRIVLNYFKQSNTGVYSPKSGGYIKLFNFGENYDFYTELIYRSSISFNLFDKRVKVDDSYDLNVSLKVKLDKKKSLTFKGENLLNKGIKYPFYIPLLDTVKYIPTFDRTIYIVFEYNL